MKILGRLVVAWMWVTALLLLLLGAFIHLCINKLNKTNSSEATHCQWQMTHDTPILQKLQARTERAMDSDKRERRPTKKGNIYGRQTLPPIKS
jgi:hypothetical protein